MQKIAVLIPCYNEEYTIEKVVNDFKKELPKANIYVYDNNSKDKTIEKAKKAGAIVRSESRQGNGNVIRTLFNEIEADIYVIVDGDDTYQAEYVHQLIEPIIENQADMTVGDRLSNGTYQQKNKRHFHNFGNKLVRKSINTLFNSKLRDIMTGYRAFNKRFVKNMPVMSANFELETEMTLFALDKKYRIKEIPIEFRERPEGSKSKVNTFTDGMKVIKTIIKMFKDYRPLKFFSIIFIILFSIGILVGIPVIIEFYKTGYITKMPSAILATGIITLSVISEQCGLILHTIVKLDKQNYELNLLRYKQIEELKNKNI